MTSRKPSKMHQRVLDKNRLSLDELAKPPLNDFWDVAHQHYNSSIGAIAQVEGTLKDVLVEFVRDPANVEKIKDQVTLANNINILTKDITEHVDRLNGIYAKHSDKNGSTITPDEHMELLQIHGEYAEALEIYEANIVPTVAYILEQIGSAEELIATQSSLTDPNVVSDVEVKEPSTALVVEESLAIVEPIVEIPVTMEESLPIEQPLEEVLVVNE